MAHVNKYIELWNIRLENMLIRAGIVIEASYCYWNPNWDTDMNL